MHLTFVLNEEDDILNTTIRDSDTGSVVYTTDTPRRAEGVLTTTVTRWNRADGSTGCVFRIMWRGKQGSLDDVGVMVGERAYRETPAGEILGRDLIPGIPSGSTYGAMSFLGLVCKWKSKGIGSKLVLVADADGATVAQSHSRRRSGFLTKPRDMSLEVSKAVEGFLDLILVAFILIWTERQNERAKVSLTMGPGNAFGQRPV